MLTWQTTGVFLNQIVHRLRQGLDVGDRTFRSKTYKSCFVAYEAVDFMVKNEIADSREEAIELGRYLSKERSLWRYVCGSSKITDDHQQEFGDEFLLFRFTSDDDDEEEEEYDENDENNPNYLSNIASRLHEGLEIKDRKFRFKTYKSCIVTCDAVTYMVENGMADSRDEAVLLGRRLEDELDLWHHVCNDHMFKDEHLFFRFTCDDCKNEGSLKKTLQTVPLSDIATDLQAGLEVKDRRFHFKTYKSCFVASEAVDYMIQNDMVGSREEAVVLGRLLSSNMNLWHHVCDDHEFMDAHLFFRFLSYEKRCNDDDDMSVATFRTCESSSRQFNLSVRLNISQWLLTDD